MSEHNQQPPLAVTETTDTPQDSSAGQENTGQGVSDSPATSTTQSTTINSMPSATMTSQSNSGHIPSHNEQTGQPPSTSHINHELQYYLRQQKENIELQNKGFESMKILMQHVNKASENLLAAERLRIPGARGNILNSTSILEDVTTQTGNNSNVQTNPQEINLEVTKVLNDSLTALKSTIESNKKSQSYQIPRNYFLNHKRGINIWLDKLKFESLSKDLLHIIDSTVNAPSNLEEQATVKRQQAVREITTSHLDDKYYKRVLNIEDPTMIIQSLKESKRVENNVTHTSVRTKLYQLRLQFKESIDDFCNRFDNIVIEYEIVNRINKRCCCQ